MAEFVPLRNLAVHPPGCPRASVHSLSRERNAKVSENFSRAGCSYLAHLKRWILDKSNLKYSAIHFVNNCTEIWNAKYVVAQIRVLLDWKKNFFGLKFLFQFPTRAQASPARVSMACVPMRSTVAGWIFLLIITYARVIEDTWGRNVTVRADTEDRVHSCLSNSERV